MSARTIQLVTFDLDNTLWPVEEVIILAERNMRDWFATNVPGFNEAFPHEEMLSLRGALIAKQPDLAHDLSAMRIAILKQALQQFDQPEAAANELAEHAFKIFLDGRHQVRYFDGVMEMLESLTAGYTLAALSNGNADVSRLAIDQHFSFSFSAASVGASKPHPAMFEAALAQANVAPQQAVHIGDNPTDDVQGASAVGMRTIWLDLNGKQGPGAAAPCQRVTAIDQIADAVRALD